MVLLRGFRSGGTGGERRFEAKVKEGRGEAEMRVEEKEEGKGEEEEMLRRRRKKEENVVNRKEK